MVLFTGLDPAKPFFENHPPSQRLHHNDADFVDVYHSDTSGFGLLPPIGDLDVFMNGGEKQPHCLSLTGGVLKNAEGEFIENTLTYILNQSSVCPYFIDLASVFCNHGAAFDLYAETVKKEDPLIAYSCDSYEDFTSGKCFTCNATSTKGNCVGVGYRYGQDPGTMARHKVFLLTRDERAMERTGVALL